MTTKEHLLRTIGEMANDAGPGQRTTYDNLYAMVKDDAWRSSARLVEDLMEDAPDDIDDIVYQNILSAIDDLSASSNS